MRRLEAKYADELVVIGVHSAKFPSEQLTANIRQAVMRHDIHHPVINDAGFRVWRQYGVSAWPTIVLIDPLGRYVGSQPGEITFEQFDPIIGAMVAEFAGEIDRRPIAGLAVEGAVAPARPLRYPAKVLAAGGMLFVSDTGHHRVIELALDEGVQAGEVLRVFGSGEPGLTDGAAATARFNAPHGLALHDGTLYVADTDNHAIRAIDLARGEVRTVAGTGEKASGSFALGDPTETPLRSPWDLLAVDGALFIAMAGSHQIWVLLDEAQLGPFAGSGREELVDGPRERAGFNQPSGLAFDGATLYVADAEASAVRAIALDAAPQVRTLVGEGLFEFGDRDGVAGHVRLQHPTGITWAGDALVIADSYNNKLKRLDPATRRVTTLVGDQAPGDVDGPFSAAHLYEPEGVSAASDGLLFVADTNNHLIRVADPQREMLWTLMLRGLDRLHMSPTGAAAVRLAPQTVAPGTVVVALHLGLPPGHTRNPDAPLTIRASYGGRDVVHEIAPGAAPAFSVAVTERGDLALDLTVIACEAEDARLCTLHDLRLVQPLMVAEDGASAIHIPVTIDPAGS